VLHGGYWQATYNLIHLGHLCEALRAVGIASWNLEYRRLGDPGGAWPAAAEDLDRALGHRDRLPFDHDGRTLLVGHSAGGQLALWAAKRSGLPVLALAPVSDVRDAAERRGAESPPGRYMAPEHFAHGSPIELLPLGVQQILIHGTADDSVPYETSVRYVEAAGAEAELVTLEGAGHFEPIDPRSTAWPEVTAALGRLLGAPASAAPPR
jgi:pimeloyl-ACP methyl ester carboxylesterase